MFSKNNNTYLIPQYFSSSSSSPSSLNLRPNASLDLNSVEFMLHHHPEMFSGHYLTANAPPLVHAAALLTQDDGGTLTGEAVPSAATANSLQRKQPTKKDRHSKIFTAQGPRDRRVRLSIGIARKFFDLQETLGFDKPSKTLDWLLTKSKAAIKELTQMKENVSCANKSAYSDSPSECELVSSESNGDAFENGMDTKRKFVKESRAKARARARERTREKMSINNINNMGSDLNPSFFQSSSSAGYERGITAHQDLIQESVVVKRKMVKNNNNPSFFGFQQNVFVSRDLSSNYGVPSSANNNAAENWDFCSFTSQSNLCAILDQHKFINSSSNM